MTKREPSSETNTNTEDTKANTDKNTRKRKTESSLAGIVGLIVATAFFSSLLGRIAAGSDTPSATGRQAIQQPDHRVQQSLAHRHAPLPAPAFPPQTGSPPPIQAVTGASGR